MKELSGVEVETVGPQLNYAWPVVAEAGPLGPVLLFEGVNAARPSDHTIDWSVGGTAPDACTFRTEASSDLVNWYGLDATSPDTIDGTSSGMESIVGKPVLFLRINVVTYTEGDDTTTVVFHYTGSRK